MNESEMDFGSASKGIQQSSVESISANENPLQETAIRIKTIKFYPPELGIRPVHIIPEPESPNR